MPKTGGGVEKERRTKENEMTTQSPGHLSLLSEWKMSNEEKKGFKRSFEILKE